MGRKKKEEEIIIYYIVMGGIILVIIAFKLFFAILQFLFTKISEVVRKRRAVGELYNNDVHTVNDMYNELYSLSSREFEILISELYKSKGYNTTLTNAKNDYGRDVVVQTSSGKIFIECKRFASNNYVGREIAQKLLGSMQMFNADRGIIYTTGKFNENAYEVARMVNNLELRGAEEILSMLYELDEATVNRIFFKARNQI